MQAELEDENDLLNSVVQPPDSKTRTKTMQERLSMENGDNSTSATKNDVFKNKIGGLNIMKDGNLTKFFAKGNQ